MLHRSNACTRAHLTSLLRAYAKAAGNDLGAIGHFIHLRKDYAGEKRAEQCVETTMRWMSVSSSKNVSGMPMTTGALPGMMLPTCSDKTVRQTTHAWLLVSVPDLVDCLGHCFGLDHKMHSSGKREECPSAPGISTGRASGVGAQSALCSVVRRAHINTADATREHLLIET
jgi:hypothetical protein